MPSFFEVQKYLNPASNVCIVWLSFRISEEEYVKAIKEEINKVVKLQEELDIDVLVHGEPEVSYLEPFEEEIKITVFVEGGCSTLFSFCPSNLNFILTAEERYG